MPDATSLLPDSPDQPKPPVPGTTDSAAAARSVPQETEPDTLAKFKADLQLLRERAGRPIYIAIAHKSGVSKSIVGGAFVGDTLPTEKTVLAVVRALGDEPEPWLQRRAALDPKVTRVGIEMDTETHRSRQTTHGNTGKRRVSLRTTILVGVASSVAAATITSLIWAGAIQQEAPVAAVAPAGEYLPFADGVDPMQTICREDAVIAASEVRLDGDAQVQMMYSKKCMAVWGRVTRYDDQAAGNTLAMTIYPATDQDSSRNQTREAFDVQSIYTTLMIEPEVEARVCGLATITQGDKTIDLGPPLCV